MIVVEWDGAREFISVDPKPAYSVVPKIARTSEYWPPARTVEYHTESHGKILPNGALELVLSYRKQKNAHLAPLEGDVLWGVSTIILPPGATTGTAVWEDFDDSYYNGQYQWNLLPEDLLKKPSRELVSRQKRRQAQFKAELLACGAQCALSGDQTVEALEAAHVIPSMAGGNEIVANGLLLRADLHRLFDAGLFTIKVNGRVALSSAARTALSTPYFELLSRARLSAPVHARVKAALLHVRVSASQA